MKHALIAAALLAAPQLAQAQSCLSRQEVSTLIVFSAPTLIEAAAAKCAPSLSANAYLRTGAPRLAARLRSEGESRTGNIVEIFGKMGDEKIPAGLSNDTLKGIIRDVFASEIAKDIKPKDCGGIDYLVASMDPIPASNIGDLVAGILALTGPGNQSGPFRVCADPAR